MPPPAAGVDLRASDGSERADSKRRRPPRRAWAGPLGGRAEAEETAEQDQKEVGGWGGADAEKEKKMPPTRIFLPHVHLHQWEQVLKAPRESRTLPCSPFPQCRAHRARSSLRSTGLELYVTTAFMCVCSKCA
jgi:hypothetical protein